MLFLPAMLRFKALIWTALWAGTSYSQEMVLAKTTTVHSSPPDTVITLYQYDRNGFLVRTVARDNFVQDWDSFGRSIGHRTEGDTAYTVKTTWFSADSAQRRTPGFDEPLGERWFGRRKNCWCADSIYIYREIHTLMAKMFFIFDTLGSVTRHETLFLLP